MNTINAAFHNYVLMSAVIAWLIAQVMKTTVTFIKLKRFEPERLVGAGGMPSAHSATVCALTIAISRVEGVSSPLFAIAFLFSIIVMYDAMGVRRAAGEHAKAINEMRRMPPFNQEEGETAGELPEPLDEEEKELKEYLGHTPLEVLAGALLGILVAMIVPQ